MTQEELKQKYLAKGYDEKYFPYFFDEWESNVDIVTNGDEQQAIELAFVFVDIFNAQAALGHSVEWSQKYASISALEKDIDFSDDYLVAEILECVDREKWRHDLEIFVKDFKKDEVFNFAYVEAWECDTLSAPKSMGEFAFAKEYSRIYHCLREEGHSDDYAKGWLYVQGNYDCKDQDLYAKAYEAAKQHDFSLYDALSFADKVCFIYDYPDEIPSKRLEYQAEYVEDWQRPFFEKIFEK